MRILFDTNILISAFISFKSGSMCYDIIDHAVESHELYYTDFIITEFKKVLREDFDYPETVINEFITFITRFFIKGETAETTEKICRDSKDDQVICDAVSNDIEVIITGDKDLLVLRKHKSIDIIRPQDYWKL
jgi:putative PIN family toxin of toxin-antitoxin system